MEHEHEHEYEWYDKASIAFKKLSPKSGDIITVSVPPDTDPRQVQMIEIMLKEAVDDALPNGCNVLLLSQGVELQHFSKNEMARLGWYKLGGNQ